MRSIHANCEESDLGRKQPAAQVTRLLRAWCGGDPTALEQLMPLVYEELRRMARRYMLFSEN